MGILETLIISMGIAWGSGINLYAAVATLGILGATGNIVLPGELVILSDPLVIGAASVMYVVEFFADKVPGVDTGWDTLHTFIRIPAAAILAAGAVGEVNPAMTLVAGILGGALAATSHTLKAGSRVLINASPEPFSNIGASLVEDTVVFAGLLGAVYYPGEFLLFMALFIAAAIWAIPKIWRGIRFLASRLSSLFRSSARTPPAGEPAPMLRLTR